MMPKMRSARRKQKDREKQRSAALESPSALLTYVEQVFTQEVERLAAQKREFDLAYEETVNNLRSEYTKIRAQLENSEVPAQPSTPKHSKSLKDVFHLRRSPTNSNTPQVPTPVSISSPKGVSFGPDDTSSDLVALVQEREQMLLETLYERERVLASMLAEREQALVQALATSRQSKTKGRSRRQSHHKSTRKHRRASRSTPSISTSKDDICSPKSDAQYAEDGMPNAEEARLDESEKSPASPLSIDDAEKESKSSTKNVDQQTTAEKTPTKSESKSASSPVRDVVANGNGETLHEDENLLFWEKLCKTASEPSGALPTPKVRVMEEDNWLCCLQYDVTRKHIVGGSLNSRTIHVWEENGKRLEPLEGHRGIVYCIQIRGDTLVSGSGDGTFRVWDLKTGKCVRTVQAHTPKGIVCLQFDDEIVVTGCTLFSIKVWNFATGDYIRTLRGHLQAVWCLQFDKKRIISGSEDRMIKVWDRATGQCPMTLKGHEGPVRCLRFNNDVVVSGSEDKTIRIWSLKTGQCVKILTGHDATVICLDFFKNTIISGSIDNTLRVWDSETSRSAVLRGHKLGVYCLQVHGSSILSGSEDGSILEWKFYDD